MASIRGAHSYLGFLPENKDRNLPSQYFVTSFASLETDAFPCFFPHCVDSSSISAEQGRGYWIISVIFSSDFLL